DRLVAGADPPWSDERTREHHGSLLDRPLARGCGAPGRENDRWGGSRPASPRGEATAASAVLLLSRQADLRRAPRGLEGALPDAERLRTRWGRTTRSSVALQSPAGSIRVP